jgi:hypothetical protein
MPSCVREGPSEVYVVTGLETLGFVTVMVAVVVLGTPGDEVIDGRAGSPSKSTQYPSPTTSAKNSTPGV